MPSMALNDCYFFIILEKHSRCLVMCSSNVGTGESPDLSDVHPCRSCRSLAIAPGQSSRPELRNGDLQEEQSISRWRKMLVCKNGPERQAPVFKKKSANPSGVIFETGSVHHSRWVGDISPLSVRQIHKSRSKPNKHTIYRTGTGIKLHLILFFFFFLLSSWLVSTKEKKKKTAAQF